ncbi:MAG: Flp pilus assembly complex ATPase component TadA [Alphaproteobacteria bacterium]|nr:Flp pilus assembly complex ATPase component TadA [Alphaproteobacteria bacterium]
MTLINDINFSDIYITPDRDAFIPDNRTPNGLMRLAADDFNYFFDKVEKTYDGHNPSYSVLYNKIFYRVERSQTIYGVQYCARKMPPEVPSFSLLNFPIELRKYLLSLSNTAGLILWSGPTGAGKTTAISSLMKEYLISEGGFAYTIEDPSEMPLDGTYNAINGSLALCKQTQPVNGNWGDCLKSALRSKPRFIMVGEIRTPDTASEVLRACTSGHLVLSSIHANNIADAINSVVKYASSSGMTEDLAYDLFSRGMLAVMHQTLVGIRNKMPQVSYLFANPDTTQGDQVRAIVKTGKLNLGTAIDTQRSRLTLGKELFPKLHLQD